METIPTDPVAWFAALWTIVQEVRHLITSWRKRREVK